jgi:hypothetical protein
MKSPDPTRRQQSFQPQKYLTLAPAKDICQDRSCVVIDGMPELPWLLLLPDKTPYFIDFGVINPANGDFHIARV